MTEQIEQFFQSYRSAAWQLPGQQLPQEDFIGGNVVEPTGWVVNAPSTVMIDDAGIHIFDGAIFLEDEFGDSVLTASGFAGTWIRFLASGLYNSDFRAGLIADVPMSIGYDTVDTPSSILPYWVGARHATTNPLNWRILHRSDTTADSGKSIRIEAQTTHALSESAGILQRNIPVDSGEEYYVVASIKWQSAVPASKRVVLTAGIAFFDADGILIGSEVVVTESLNNSSTSTWLRRKVVSAEAPARSTTARIRVVYNPIFGTTAGDYLDINYISFLTDEGDTQWTSAILNNGWVNYDPNTFPAAGYFKDSNGFIHLRGLIKDGTVGAGAFTLPSPGYRPNRVLHFPTISNNAFGRISVGSNGVVQPDAPSSNVWVSLDGITFDGRA